MTTVSHSWSKLPLFLCLLLLAPRVGLAAEDAPLRSTAWSIPGTDERESLGFLEEFSEEPQPLHAPVGLRIAAEVGGGLLTALGGGLAGGLVGLGVCAAMGYSATSFYCLSPSVLGVLVGSGLGYPLGVWWAGEAVGGDGSLLASFVGMGAATLVGLLLTAANGSLGLSIPVLGLAGPVLGYEFSQRREPGPPAMASARPRLQPLLSVSTGGALLGLGGTF